MDDDDPWLLNFEWVEPLGDGGMGSVYLCEDLRNGNSPCVIKMISKENKDLFAQAEMIKIWQREGEMLRRLNHRGIVKYLDEHFSLACLYVVMEHIPGQNLEKVIVKEGALDSEVVVRIGLQCCDVLEYLHSFEPPIIYRDLKPSNLMLRPDGLVVFVDFGIARDFEPHGPATRVVTSGYSPPEQYFGKPEPRGDLYSLGATLHHLLTGVRPKPLQQCSPRKLNNNVLPALDALVKQLTFQEKNDRPPSARAVQFELFKIYKSLHPDFEIPDLEMDDWDEDYEEYDDDDVDSPNTNSNKKNDRDKNKKRPGLNGIESGGSSVILNKIKQWIKNRTGSPD